MSVEEKSHDSNIRRKAVRAHIQDVRTIASLVSEYGISGATVSNWVRSYREECQNNGEEKSQLEMMEELRRLRREKAELEKETGFLKKRRHSLRRESISDISFP